MYGHITKLASDLKEVTSPSYNNKLTKLNIFNVPKMIFKEIENLNSLNFEADVRYDFIILRNRIEHYASQTSLSGAEYIEEYKKLSENLITIFKKYKGFNNDEYIKKFDFLRDSNLREIVERDYYELSVILFPEGAWKSVVIIAGGILEAILFDLLANDTNQIHTNQSQKAPKRKNCIIPINEEKGWTLQKLIEVSVDINILPQNRASSIDQVLRDYRNFIHPKKEIRSKHQCSEAEALMAKGALDGIYNHFKVQQNSGRGIC